MSLLSDITASVLVPSNRIAPRASPRVPMQTSSSSPTKEWIRRITQVAVVVGAFALAFVFLVRSFPPIQPPAAQAEAKEQPVAETIPPVVHQDAAPESRASEWKRKEIEELIQTQRREQAPLRILIAAAVVGLAVTIFTLAKR